MEVDSPKTLLNHIQDLPEKESDICHSDSKNNTENVEEIKSPSKSPMVLSFDAYGNLTSTSDPTDDLNALDDLKFWPEDNFQKGKEEVKTTKDSKSPKDALLHKPTKLSRPKPKRSKSPVITDEALEKAFKPSISVVPKTRSGRPCKQKSEAGFLFGTFNFNEYKKLTSPSPKRNKQSIPESEANKNLDNSLGSSPMTHSTDAEYSSSEEFQSPPTKVINKRKNNSGSNSDSLNQSSVSESETESGKPKVKKGHSRKRNQLDQISSGINGDITPKVDGSVAGSKSEKKSKLREKKAKKNNLPSKPIKVEYKELGSLEDDVDIIKNSLKDSDDDATAVKVKSEPMSPDHKDAILVTASDTTELKVEKEQESATPKGKENSPETTTKFGRQIKKPEFIDLSLSNKKNKEVAIKPVHSPLIEQSLTSKDKSNIDKEYPCLFCVGDLFWVMMTSSPFWPAMITYPIDEENYTKLKPIGKGNMKKIRRYHLTFFNDKEQTIWTTGNNLIKYEGREHLESYLESFKSTPIKQRKGVFWQVFSKTMYLTKKQQGGGFEKWKGAIEEADKFIPLERYQRLQAQKENFRESKEEEDQTKKNIRKRKLSKARSEQQTDDNTFDEKSQPEFLGFDSQSSEEPKAKKQKLALNVHGSFDIYLQKHIDLCLKDNPSYTEETAKKLLRSKWRKLTPVQKARYKSRKNTDNNNIPVFTIDSDDTNSEASCPISRKKKANMKSSDGNKGTYKVPRNEKVCFICGFVGVQDEIIKCRGVCNGNFHLACVGLNVLPSTSDFKCASCVSGIHSCFVCKSNEGKTIRCSVTACGKFYHDSCIRKWPQVCKSRQFEKLVCPRHACHMCAANADDMNDPAARTAPFTRCIHCPTTYHTGDTCIAAGVEEITINYHICTKHLLPKNNLHYNVNWCFCCSKGGSLLLCDQCPAAFHAECMNISTPEGSYVCEDCENGKYPVYGDIVWVKIGAHRWWPAEVLHPKYIPDNIENLSHQQGMFCVHFFGTNEYFWVSRGRAFLYQEGDQGSKGTRSKVVEQRFKKALEEAIIAYHKQQKIRDEQEETRSLKGNKKPPPYVRIDTNKPVGNVRLGKLDLSSVNKCECDPFLDNPCSSDEKCLNRMLMIECIREACRAGEQCQNQRFQKRLYPTVMPFKTSATGWGLKTKEFIKKGDFIIEYVGELIDDTEMKRRIEEMHECNEQNFYFLTIDKDTIIDAGPKGNLARFMNHSCDPNCVTQKWTVGPDTRVGLFALYDIPEGSELNFNYNLECIGTGKKKCNCGSKKCSGFIGAKIQKPESNGVSKSTKKKKRRRIKKKKPSENECFRCYSSGGDLVLCDAALCPKGYHQKCLKLNSLPKGKWICPWHYCDVCGTKASNRCLLCPNSYCRFHLAGNFHKAPGLGNICMDHSAEEYETLRGQTVEAQAPPAPENLPGKEVQKRKAEDTEVVPDAHHPQEKAALPDTAPPKKVSAERGRRRSSTLSVLAPITHNKIQSPTKSPIPSRRSNSGRGSRSYGTKETSYKSPKKYKLMKENAILPPNPKEN